MTFTVVMTEADESRLRDLVFSNGENEGVAYVLLGRATIPHDPWTGAPTERFLLHEVVPIAHTDILTASPVQITWRTETFVRLLRRARQEKWLLGVVHSHPHGPSNWSRQDDTSESELCSLLQRRNRTTDPFLSILLAPDDTWLVRKWASPEKVECSDRILTVGNRFRLRHDARPVARELARAWNRQALALGGALTDDLRALRVGVVGVGGTGSALTMQLARLGVGQLLVVDPDYVDHTNLGRLHGATLDDADQKKLKVDVMAREVERMGLGTRVVRFATHLHDPSVRTALAACDLVFGCTDDHDGRLLLNRLAYFYLKPVIDLGLGSTVNTSDAGARLNVEARVTVLTPGTRCLLCHRVVNLARARAEQLERMDPLRYARDLAEAYVEGEGNPSPAVVTFTTGVAILAMEEFLHRIQGFRGPVGHVDHRVRFAHRSSERRPGAERNPNCSVCEDPSYWGRGDIVPYLDRTG